MMDEKQAIGLLGHHTNTWKGKFPPGHFQACELAIEALEKQIPKKLYKTYSIDYATYGECPNCNHTGLKKYAHEHCHWCGQKLDWEESQ